MNGVLIAGVDPEVLDPATIPVHFTLGPGQVARAVRSASGRRRYGWLALQSLLWVLCLWYLWHSRVAKEDARDRDRLRKAVDL